MNFFQRTAASAKVLFGRLEAVYKGDLEEANMYIDSLSRRLKEAESRIQQLTAIIEKDAKDVAAKIDAAVTKVENLNK